MSQPYGGRPSGPPRVPGNSILGVLQAAQIDDSKPVLTAEILARVLDHLPVADQLRFARVSRRLREMVYDDSRWVTRLQSMGLWNEADARRHFEEAMAKRRRDAQAAAAAAVPANSTANSAAATTTLFDASLEERRRQQVRDGFETLSVAGTDASRRPQDPDAVLAVLTTVKSVRGHARDEYGKVYGALAPFYFDLQTARTHADPAIFKVFRDPERQAQMLANLRVFSQSDWAQGWHGRADKLATMTAIFESAVLREFEQGYEFWDVDGRMHKYAHVLDTLGASTAGTDLFVQKHPLFDDTALTSMNAMDCLRAPAAPAASTDPESAVTLDPSRAFFALLTQKVNEQSDVIRRIFPRPGRVFWALVDKVREDLVMEYITPLLDETHEHNLPAYLTAVSGLFEQCLLFLQDLDPPKPPGHVDEPPSAPRTQQDQAAEKTAALIKRRKPAGDDTVSVSEHVLDADDELDAWRPAARLRKVRDLAYRAFEPHLDLYLQEELDHFTKHAAAEVHDWTRKLSAQDASVESFYMASFNRREVKNDFLSSFKKVVMMPVTVLPSLPGLGTSKTSKPELTPGTKPELPTLGALDKAPDDELAAKAALMASRLAGIKSLFSLEMALSLVHAAKTSLGRAAVFVPLGGQAAGEAREQCEAIFVELLRILGTGHVKQGFDRAVEHLSQYNPRSHAKSDKNPDGDGGVAPLMTFIELVNVGDLISQMVDLFYEQQLAGPKIVDRNDFLDPAGLAKKRFEQMIDESVAAGLNKGIDVLMDEVEYICATTQKPTDYYPEAADAVADTGLFFLGAASASSTGTNVDAVASGSTPALDAFAAADIGPTPTAERVVALVRGHTSMLTGSTEKTMLDVFNGEVGLRLFTAVCKHLKRQRISVGGAVRVIADMTLYFDFVRTLRNPDLLAYFRALRELSQLYLIDARHHAKEMAVIIADNDRFGGIFRAEEVYEFAERRADWYQVKRNVERAMYGLECRVM